MLQMAGYTVCSKRQPFNRPRSISLLSFSLRGCLVKTRTRLPIVCTARSWVYPSFSSSSHGQICWHPTASSPFWLVSTTTALHSGLERPRFIRACLWEDDIALSPSSFWGLTRQRVESSWLRAPPGLSLGELGHLALIVREPSQVVAGLFDFCLFFLSG